MRRAFLFGLVFLSASSLAAFALGACSSDSEGASPALEGGPAAESGDPRGDSSDPDGGSSDGGLGGDVAILAKSSGGSGGLTCASNGSLPGGRTYCVATESGVEIKLAVPVGGSATEPLRLAIYLHGDGAAAHKSDSAMKAILPFADAHHALVVSVLSPNGCAWWQAPTQTDCSETATQVPDTNGVNADAFAAVLTKIRSAYDVSNAPVFYYGSSGGSIFLTRSFLRRFGDRYPGAFALNCGGEMNDLPFAWDTSSAAARSATKLYFTYGDQDFLKTDIETAQTHYAGLGFPIDTKVIPGATHCAFDGHGRAVEVWTAFLGE